MKDTEPTDITQEIIRQNTESIHSKIELLASDPDLRELIRHVGKIRFNEDINYELGDFKAMHGAMDCFDSRTKKDGTYGERAEADEIIFDPETDQQIYKLAEKFGLTGDTVPSRKDADAALVLGGAAKAPLNRAFYTRELLEKGLLETDTIIFLASDRPVDDNERQRAGEYAHGATSEFELNIKAAESVFGVEFAQEDMVEFTDPNVPHGFPNHARVAHNKDKSGRDIFIIAAPLVTDPFEVRNGEEIIRRRANTRDTYAMLRKMADLKAGANVVGITNAHFVPFQGADAQGQLGLMGIQADIIGYDPSHFGDKQKTSQELLQEMLTVADSLKKATETI